MNVRIHLTSIRVNCTRPDVSEVFMTLSVLRLSLKPIFGR